jgi:hypothetical protein
MKVEDLVKLIDDATNAVASRISGLIDKLREGGDKVTVDEVANALQPEIDRLRSLGADPSEPVPTE